MPDRKAAVFTTSVRPTGRPRAYNFTGRARREGSVRPTGRSATYVPECRTDNLRAIIGAIDF